MKVKQQHFNSLMINKKNDNKNEKNTKKNSSLSEFSFRNENLNKSFSFSLDNKYDLNKIFYEQNQEELIKNKLEKLSVFGKKLLNSNEKLITNNNFIDEIILNDKFITPNKKNNNKINKKPVKSFSTTHLKITKKINVYKYNNINNKEIKNKIIKSPNQFSNKLLLKEIQNKNTIKINPININKFINKPQKIKNIQSNNFSHKKNLSLSKSFNLPYKNLITINKKRKKTNSMDNKKINIMNKTNFKFPKIIKNTLNAMIDFQNIFGKKFENAFFIINKMTELDKDNCIYSLLQLVNELNNQNLNYFEKYEQLKKDNINKEKLLKESNKEIINLQKINNNFLNYNENENNKKNKSHSINKKYLNHRKNKSTNLNSFDKLTLESFNNINNKKYNNNNNKKINSSNKNKKK